MGVDLRNPNIVLPEILKLEGLCARLCEAQHLSHSVPLRSDEPLLQLQIALDGIATLIISDISLPLEKLEILHP
jgi:hypothetical protein